jgi:cell division protein FtsW
VGAFQPAEFVKLVLVLYLADVLERKKEQMRDFQTGLMPRLAVVGIVLGLIVLQPDLGTAIAIGFVALVMLWLGGAQFKHLLVTVLAGVPVVAYSLYRSPYQMRRILSFLEMADPRGADYQLNQSLLALGSGGPIGTGLGNSMQKYFLPETHTDFIFSFIGEELGLAGTLSVIALFIAFGIHGVRVARQSPTYYGFLVASGVTAMISIYAILNMGVATGLLPTTGLPLPFVSYGGSALVWNLAGVGLLIAIARECGPGTMPWLGAAQGRSERPAL